MRLGAFALIPFLGFSDGAGLQVEIITVLEVLNGLRESPDYEVLPIERAKAGRAGGIGGGAGDGAETGERGMGEGGEPAGGRNRGIVWRESRARRLKCLHRASQIQEVSRPIRNLPGPMSCPEPCFLPRAVCRARFQLTTIRPRATALRAAVERHSVRRKNWHHY